MNHQPGQQFRGIDMAFNLRRISKYEGCKPVLSIAVSEIEVALARESNCKRPRAKLCEALEAKLAELREKGLA